MYKKKKKKKKKKQAGNSTYSDFQFDWNWNPESLFLTSFFPVAFSLLVSDSIKEKKTYVTNSSAASPISSHSLPLLLGVREEVLLEEGMLSLNKKIQNCCVVI